MLFGQGIACEDIGVCPLAIDLAHKPCLFADFQLLSSLFG